MKSIFYFIFIILSMLHSSCEIDPKPGPGESVDTGISIILKNVKGENLLDENTNNKIIIDSIRIYYVENGVESEFFHPNLDHPRNFYVYDDNTYSKVFFVFPSSEIFEPGKKEVNVKWNSKDQDTINANIIHKKIGNGSMTYCDSVWVNGVLKFPNLEFHPSRKFILVK